MRILGPAHYVPILVGKLGELVALQQAPADVRMGLTPLLDVPPIPKPHPPKPGEDPKEETPPEVYIAKLLHACERLLRCDHQLLLDLNGLERYRPKGRHPVAFASDPANQRGLLVRVVLSNRSAQDYVDALIAGADAFAGVALRLHVDDPADAEGAAAGVEALLEQVGRPPEAMELIVDLGQLASGVDRDAVRDLLTAMPYFDRWRALVLASTAVPEAKDRPPQGGFDRYPRRDWRLWQRMFEAGVEMTFSDYGITGPRSDSTDPPFNPAPNLRYTTSDALLWWKGHKDDPPPGERKLSYIDLARMLVNDSGRFAGPSCSWGDAMIAARLEPDAGKGNPQKWVEWATNHHLAEVRAALEAYA